MGCASSSCAESQNKNSGLQLMTSKLHFQDEQLRALNHYFRILVERDNETTVDIVRVESTVERLVQRLIGGVGNLDRRFSATFLVSLNERRRLKQLRFEYLLRLDALSSPLEGEQPLEGGLALSLEEDSGLPGFARLRLRTGDAGAWAEFVGTDGRLRRDLIKARVASLLATAVRQDAINGIDERFCITPGQVVDAEVLDKILKLPDHCRIFYGPAESESKLPDVAQHRVIVVEDEDGIILKIGLDGSKSQDIEVRLLIGASINSWPMYADYPKRVPLYHCDALLHYTAAQSGMYVVAGAPRQGSRCDDRPSLWRIRLPAAETAMRQHYCDQSVAALTEDALLHVLDQLRARLLLDFPVKRKGPLRLVSRHIVKTIHWWSLERTGPDPLKNWAPDTLSQHVLLALDELLRALKCQNLRSYFQPRCNLMLQCVRGGGLVEREDVYALDGRLLESYLTALHGYSGEHLLGVPERGLPCSELLEKELLARWPGILASFPRATADAHRGYAALQLQYLGLVVEQILRAKDCLAQEGFDTFNSLFNVSSDSQAGESMENLIYLISLVLKQAKDQVQVLSSGRRKKRNRRRSRAERKRSCAKAFFSRSADMLIDIVRKDRETAYLDLDDYVIMAKTLLKWLYFATEEDGKVLGPLLRPYLSSLFIASLEYGWHVESWRYRARTYRAEARSLGLFCKLVSGREISPANGIVESLSKGWSWAESLARMIERSDNGLKLIFLATHQRPVFRYQLKFAEDKGPTSGSSGSFSAWSKARKIGDVARRASRARTSLISASDTLPRLSSSSSPLARRAETNAGNKEVAGHVELRDSSPLTLIARMARRRGRQRGPGGLIPALVTLNKFRVLQEVAQVLPQEERTAMLELVQRASREAARLQRRASCPDQSTLGRNEPRQLYTPRSESKLHDEVMEQCTPQTREQHIILERQLQLRREILEIHDTLTRGLRTRSHLPTWDSMSMASWASSSGSIGHGKLKRHKTAIWTDTNRGSTALWDSISSNSTFNKIKSGDAKRNESRSLNNLVDTKDVIGNDTLADQEDQKLPSWELLEKSLNKKFFRYEYVKPNFFEENKDVNIERLVINNDTKEFADKQT